MRTKALGVTQVASTRPLHQSTPVREHYRHRARNLHNMMRKTSCVPTAANLTILADLCNIVWGFVLVQGGAIHPCETQIDVEQRTLREKGNAI